MGVIADSYTLKRLDNNTLNFRNHGTVTVNMSNQLVFEVYIKKR